MKVFARAVLPLSISLMFSLSAFAQNKRGAATPEERATAVKIARLLETEPFNILDKQPVLFARPLLPTDVPMF